MLKAGARFALTVLVGLAGCGGEDGPKVGALPPGGPGAAEAAPPKDESGPPKRTARGASLKGVPGPGELAQ